MRRVLAALVCLLTLSGCFGPDEVSVGYQAGTATVAEGEVLRVELGAYNTSIGDYWALLGAPDPAILTDLDSDYDDEGCPKNTAGCGGTLAWRFKAVGRGETEITLRYCYRSRVSDCQPEPGRGPSEPVTLRVTVK